MSGSPLLGGGVPALLLPLAMLALGGALGAPARLALERRLSRRGVLLANTGASLLAGFAAGFSVSTLLSHHGDPQVPAAATAMLCSALVTGFCLSLGTWSTVAGWAADAVLDSRWADAARLWATHLGVCLAAVAAGWWLGAAPLARLLGSA